MTDDLHNAAPLAQKAEEPRYTLSHPPPPPLSPDAIVEAAWQRMRSSPHGRVRWLERCPVRLFGVVADFDRVWFLYRDSEGRRQVLRAQEHDQAGIAALFAGAEGWLRRLWPAPDGGWDPERAAETLLCFGGAIGTVDPVTLGFELPREPLP